MLFQFVFNPYVATTTNRMRVVAACAHPFSKKVRCTIVGFSYSSPDNIHMNDLVRVDFSGLTPIISPKLNPLLDRSILPEGFESTPFTDIIEIDAIYGDFAQAIVFFVAPVFVPIPAGTQISIYNNDPAFNGSWDVISSTPYSVTINSTTVLTTHGGLLVVSDTYNSTASQRGIILPSDRSSFAPIVFDAYPSGAGESQSGSAQLAPSPNNYIFVADLCPANDAPYGLLAGEFSSFTNACLTMDIVEIQ